MVKDEYDFDGPQSLPSIEGGHSIQTIQHPPSGSRPAPSESYATPNLLPPAEASTSGTSSSFPAIAAGSGSKIQLWNISVCAYVRTCSMCLYLTVEAVEFVVWVVDTSLWLLLSFSAQAPAQPGPGTATSPPTYPTTPTVIYSTTLPCHIQRTIVSTHCYCSSKLIKKEKIICKANDHWHYSLCSSQGLCITSSPFSLLYPIIQVRTQLLQTWYVKRIYLINSTCLLMSRHIYLPLKFEGYVRYKVNMLSLITVN